VLREVLSLLYKELLVEWKQKYAFNGLLLYVLSMVVVISLAFVQKLNPLTWNILYWLIILFTAINAVAKSFQAEQKGQLLYLYGVAQPAAIILAKMIYNCLLLIVVAGLSLLAFAFLSGIAIADPGLLAGIVLLGSSGLAANLTLVSAIAARAENTGTLLAVLAFPLIVPLLLTLIRLSRYAIEGVNSGFDAANATEEFWLMGGMILALAVMSVVLFPFIWRD
jgi:heme exporter protein B